MKKALLLVIIASALYGALSAHSTTYIDTRALFASPSTPTEDLVAVNLQGAFDYIRVGTLSQSIFSTDLYVTFSVPTSSSCARLNGFGGGAFPVNFFLQPFTDASLQVPLTGNPVDARFGIRALPDGTCVAKFDNITLPSGSYIVLAFGLLPQFSDRLNPWPLTVTAGGTWESVPPFCSGGPGINNCVAYSGTLYVLITDVNPFPELPPQGTTYLDTRGLFVATSTPAQDLNLVNPTDGGVTQDSLITLGTISADVPGQSDYYLNFSAPFPNACATIVTNLEPSGTSFFNIAYFTSDRVNFLGHDDVADDDIKTLPDGTCVAHFRAINVRNAGTLSVLQVRHFAGSYLIPSFPLVMTSDGTWIGPLAPYCGLHCRHYSGTLYAQLSDTPFAVPSITAPSLSGLQEYKSDAMTPIIEGETTTEDTVVFGGILQSSGNRLQLEVEVKPFTNAFTNSATLTSLQVGAGKLAFVAAGDLAEGPYHWQARAVDVATGFASPWQEFGTVGTIDFKVHQVPLVTQTDAQWKDQPYANGRGNNPKDPGRCGPNISNCGCAITSIAMILQYYGITAATDNKLVNPFNLDAWLDGNNGYDEFGNLNWLKIEEYSQTSSNGLARVHYEGGFANDLGLLDSHVNALSPTILRVQVPTKSGGLASHYVVAHSKLATTYAIRDPLLFNTKTLNDPTQDLTNRIRAYGNQFAGFQIYSDLAGPIDGITFTIASPAQLLVIDPTGKRLGVDPISNISYSEIVGGTYFTDGISDISTENTTPAHEVKTIYISHPMTGDYSAQVIGTAAGTYSFSSLAYDASGVAHAQVFDGITQTNLVTPYNLNFTPQQPNSIVTTSQLVFGGLLPPIETDGSGVYNQGRILPIKFQLSDINGVILPNRIAHLFVAKIVNNVIDTDVAAHSVGGANNENAFRFDPTSNQYVFNVDTASLTGGTWQLKVVLDDGTSHTVTIFIKS